MVYGIEMSFNFRQILGPLVLGWTPNNFVLGAQHAPSEKRLACFPDQTIKILARDHFLLQMLLFPLLSS